MDHSPATGLRRLSAETPDADTLSPNLSPTLLSPMPAPPRPPSFLQRQLMLTRVTHAQAVMLERHTDSLRRRSLLPRSEVAYHEAASSTMLHAMLHATNTEKRIQVEGGWRLRMGHFLEGHHVQLVALFLVLIDVVCVVAEIMLGSVAGCQLEAEPGVIIPDGVSAVPAHRVEKWELALHWTSLAIVIVLLLQQVALLIAYGFAHLKKLFNILDICVLLVALGLELGLHGNDAPGIIVLLLFWRVVRVIHGFLATAETTEHERAVLLHALAAERRAHALDVSRINAFSRVQSYRRAARMISRWYARRKGWPVGRARVAARASGHLALAYDPAVPASFERRRETLRRLRLRAVASAGAGAPATASTGTAVLGAPTAPEAAAVSSAPPPAPARPEQVVVRLLPPTPDSPLPPALASS